MNEGFRRVSTAPLAIKGAIVRPVTGDLELREEATHFLIAVRGAPRVSHGDDRFQLRESMYFVAKGPIRVEGGTTLAVSVPGSDSHVRQLGGPIERLGRLRYIDGCTDTLLVAPTILGGPCLNHLHIPARTRQSEHTHPSERVGVIIRGSGRCVMPDSTVELEAGLMFVIDPDTRHCFHTDANDLDVMTWHPDSDFGPTHENHPMINRTHRVSPR